MNDFTTFANREVCDLFFVDYFTQKPFLNLDFANSTATEVTGDAVFAYGGQGHPKRVVFNGDRGGTLTIETQMQSMKMFSMMIGANIETSATWLKREELTADDAGNLTLTATPKKNTVNVYKADDDCGTEITDVTITDKTVTGTDITANTKYVVYYQTNLASGVKKLAIKSTTFPKAFTVYGETYDKTENDEIISQKMIAYKCQPQTNITFGWANNGDPATVTITCDLMADGDGNMLDLITEGQDD